MRQEQTPSESSQKPSFFRMTYADVIQDFKEKRITVKGLLYYIVKTKRKDGHRLRIKDVKTFCEELGISRAAYYKALKSDSSLRFDVIGEMDLWIEPNNVTLPHDNVSTFVDTDSTEVDEDSTIVDRRSTEVDTVSTIVDTSIYKERAHDRSYSDLSTDLIQIPPNPQGSDDEIFSRESLTPLPSQSNPIQPTKPNLESKVPVRDNNSSRNTRVRGVTLATRDGVPEVRVSVQGAYGVPKEDFFGAGKPWSELAIEVDATPKEIHALAQRWMTERCGDKKDPKAYASVILNGLAKDPNSKFNSLPWQQFEDAVHDQGVDELIAALQVKEASQMPKDGFHAHPCKNEWLEALRSRKMDWISFVLAGKEDGTKKVREAFYGWCLDNNLITTGWDK